MSDGFDVQRFVESFPVLAEAEGGIRKLRQLVLDFGHRGLLVEQRSAEGTAEALVRDLRAARLKSLAKAEPIAPVADDEHPFRAPVSWSWIRLADCGHFLGGGTPSKANQEFWSGKIPWVSPKDMKRPYIADAEDHISPEAVEASAVKLIPSRSLLFVVRGMILAHSFPVALTTVEVTVNQDMKALVFANADLAEYVLRACWASRDRVLAKVERSSHGTCRLDYQHVADLLIPVPPLAEQKRIVAKVDELMRLIDDLGARQTKRREVQTRFRAAALDALTKAEGPEELAAAWERAAGNFEVVIDGANAMGNLRSTLMDLAVRGRFDRVRLPDVEGDKTLGMIGEECKRLATAAGTRSHDVPTLTEGETPFHLPDAWRWVRLGSICYQITDGTHQTPHYVNSGVPFLSVKDVTGGTLDFSKVRFISPDEHAALSRRCKPQRDDILFTKVGTTGVARVVDTDREFSIFVSLALLKFPTKYIDPAFLCLVLNSPFVRQQSARNTQGIGNKNLVLRFIRECVVAIPPPSIQADVLAKVDALLKLCDDLEAKLKAKEATAGKLVEAVVRELVA